MCGRPRVVLTSGSLATKWAATSRARWPRAVLWCSPVAFATSASTIGRPADGARGGREGHGTAPEHGTRPPGPARRCPLRGQAARGQDDPWAPAHALRRGRAPVSYTHLTLPTN